MYINSEKDLEDYICNNIHDFINFLRSIYGKNHNIEFVGRQIVIGDSRMDLLFQIKGKSEDPNITEMKTFIVVELKYRQAEPKDIAQLSRYMNLLKDLEFDERIGTIWIDVKGLLVSTWLNSDMQEIQMCLDYKNADIKFAAIETNIDFKVDEYFRKEEYIENMTIDNRLKNTEEETRCGEKKND